MELVYGLPFVEAVRGGGSWAHTMPVTHPTLDTPQHASALTLDAATRDHDFARVAAASGADSVPRSSGIAPRPHARPASPPPGDEAFFELRQALSQLVDGLIAIHAAGKLHCDIKPSNVLVAPDGRVVILDFGIAMDFGARADAPDTLRGTPEYMAPEQAMFLTSSPASDWYSVGVILYEALTGRLPFEGTPLGIMVAKQRKAVTPPSEIVPGVPADLELLCMELLRREPAERPHAARVKAMLAGDAGPRSLTPSVPVSSGPRTGESLFIGRAAELTVLRDALEQTLLGEPLTMWVSGRSGMGKTALVDQFLDEARRGGVLVLSGRCYERESVPYKAFDSLVDALSRHLSTVAPEELLGLLPEHVQELALVFPVLRSVPEIEARAASPSPLAALEPHELRRRAFAALRMLLITLAGRRPLLLHIDDVQWGDADSASLLEEVLSGAGAPRMLLLLVFRSEHQDDSPMLVATRHLRSERDRTRQLEIGEIGDAEALEIARRLLGHRVARFEERAASIAREAQGSPYFLSELVRYEEERAARRAARASEPPSRRAVSLEQVLLARIARLPDDARRLLEVLSIAGGPLEQAAALRAAGLDASSPAPVATLRAVKLARTHARGGDSEVEPFHDRIRVTVAQSLEPDVRRELHERLAVELAASHAGAETVLEQFLAAGDSTHAESYARAAADAAQQGLAFRRAARLYAVAIELRRGDAPYELRRLHADALACAGLGKEAGAAYLAATARAAGGVAVETRRLAAEQLLKSGHQREGVEVLRQVLSEVGLGWPRSPGFALAALLYHRARLELTRERFQERPASAVPPVLLARADVAFTGAVGLGLTDVIRGATFGALHLRLALEAGEPFRICRGLALEAASAAAVGESGRRRSERLARAAAELASRIDDPHVVALAKLTQSSTPFFVGQWGTARRELDQVERLLRTRCRGVAWEIASAQYWSCNSLILCGELAELGRRVPTILKEARERGDRFALMQMIYAATVARLVLDDVPGAHGAANDGVPPWNAERYTSAHWGALVAAISVYRYQGKPDVAWARVEREWRALEASHLLRIQVVRVFSLFERALTAIAASGGERQALLAYAERDAQAVLREGTAYSEGMGYHVLGCVAAARGRRAAAIEAMSRGVAGLEHADMGYLAACARRRLGELHGDGEGRAHLERAAQFFSAQGVVNPGRCVEMSAPGFSRG
jgi:hypothetical protein